MTVTSDVSTEAMDAAVKEADEVLDALMARISDVDEMSSYRNLLLYGNPGTGKTVFCATAPGKVLLLAVEAAGPLSLRNHPEYAKNTRVMEFKSVRQLELLLDKMEEKPEVFAEYETLVIDSFSELQQNDLDDIVKKAAASDASRNKFLPTGPDYNINTEHMRMIGTKLERLNKNIILTCHVKEEKDESTGRLLIRPNLTPKLARTMAGKFDVVAYLNINGTGDEAVRSLQVHPAGNVTAKSRIGGLPPVIENPTWDALFGTAN
jgi:phage nucleotide-binding protein